MIMTSSSSTAFGSVRMFAKIKPSYLNREENLSTSWTALTSMMRNLRVTAVTGIFPMAATKFVAVPPHIERQV